MLRPASLAGVSPSQKLRCSPRFLGKYVLGEGLLDTEDAVRRMTSLPESRMGLNNRGLLKPGMYADIAMIDAAEIMDTATYQNPHSHARDVEYVVVNGVVAVEHGEIVEPLAGKALRHTNKVQPRRDSYHL